MMSFKCHPRPAVDLLWITVMAGPAQGLLAASSGCAATIWGMFRESGWEIKVCRLADATCQGRCSRPGLACLDQEILYGY